MCMYKWYVKLTSDKWSRTRWENIRRTMCTYPTAGKRKRPSNKINLPYTVPNPFFYVAVAPSWRSSMSPVRHNLHLARLRMRHPAERISNSQLCTPLSWLASCAKFKPSSNMGLLKTIFHSLIPSAHLASLTPDGFVVTAALSASRGKTHFSRVSQSLKYIIYAPDVDLMNFLYYISSLEIISLLPMFDEEVD